MINLVAFKLARQEMVWGTFGKEGKNKHYRRVILAYMSNSHIGAILATQPQISPDYREMFEQELRYRVEHRIFLEDGIDE